jgi:ribosome-associated protein
LRASRSTVNLDPFAGIDRMPQIAFQLEREHVELNQLLKLVGLCDSGGAGKALVDSGVVSVDGAIEFRKTCKIRAGQTVAVGDNVIHVAGMA